MTRIIRETKKKAKELEGTKKKGEI